MFPCRLFERKLEDKFVIAKLNFISEFLPGSNLDYLVRHRLKASFNIKNLVFGKVVRLFVCQNLTLI